MTEHAEHRCLIASPTAQVPWHANMRTDCSGVTEPSVCGTHRVIVWLEADTVLVWLFCASADAPTCAVYRTCYPDPRRRLHKP